MITLETKVCYRCKKELLIEKFSKRIDSTDGYRGICNGCIKINMGTNKILIEREELRKVGKRRCNECKKIFSLNKEYYFERNSEKDGWSVICRKCGAKRGRDRNYKDYLHPIYNRVFTDDDAKEMIKSQNNECLICKKKLVLNSNLYGVDHCHITMKVRGILCFNCNQGLGNFKDNIKLLKRAIIYLQ